MILHINQTQFCTNKKTWLFYIYWSIYDELITFLIIENVGPNSFWNSNLRKSPIVLTLALLAPNNNQKTIEVRALYSSTPQYSIKVIKQSNKKIRDKKTNVGREIEYFE